MIQHHRNGNSHEYGNNHFHDRQNTTNGSNGSNGSTNGNNSNDPASIASQLSHLSIPFIDQSYSNNDADASARSLILALRPDWASSDSNIEFVRFTDGITNTLLKAVNRRPGLSKDDVDREAILLRAYGHGTDLIIDRARETQNHELLMQHGLAPELLARFNNGMMYRFIRGGVTDPERLRKREIYLAVARRLAQWHATVPCLPGKTHVSEKMEGHAAEILAQTTKGSNNTSFKTLQQAIDAACPGKQAPNVWTVMQKWIFALPTDTPAQRERQALLQGELKRLVAELAARPGLGKDSLVFAHCDLLCGNVIVLPKSNETNGHSHGNSCTSTSDEAVISVTFIDYEYAVPSPAAFDIANHFAEWGGFDCDFTVLPTKSQRHDFIAEYTRTYFSMLPSTASTECSPHTSHNLDAEIKKLEAEVDMYRGVPGFYWGIWSLIQATISQIDFDYASYAEVRLGEYWDWRAELDGSRQAQGKDMPVRERRWAQES